MMTSSPWGVARDRLWYGVSRSRAPDVIEPESLQDIADLYFNVRMHNQPESLQHTADLDSSRHGEGVGACARLRTPMARLRKGSASHCRGSSSGTGRRGEPISAEVDWDFGGGRREPLMIIVVVIIGKHFTFQIMACTFPRPRPNVGGLCGMVRNPRRGHCA